MYTACRGEVVPRSCSLMVCLLGLHATTVHFTDQKPSPRGLRPSSWAFGQENALQPSQTYPNVYAPRFYVTWPNAISERDNSERSLHQISLRIYVISLSFFLSLRRPTTCSTRRTRYILYVHCRVDRQRRRLSDCIKSKILARLTELS